MISKIFQKLRDKRPLVHHITNWVTIYDCANITRAFGALPVMAHAKEEAADMAAIASALVLNIGTLTPDLIQSMILAGKSANKKSIPVVLDAVGVGATKLRDEKALELLNAIKVDIIKGNASEIAKLAGENVVTKGVESTKVEGSLVEIANRLKNKKTINGIDGTCIISKEVPNDFTTLPSYDKVVSSLVEIAKRLAKKQKSVVVITGKQDIVADGRKTYLINNGHAMMGCMVGTGCMAASIIGAFAGVEEDYAKAAAYALASFGIAGELAAAKSQGPGTFHEHFYDEAYNLTPEKVERMARI